MKKLGVLKKVSVAFLSLLLIVSMASSVLAASPPVTVWLDDEEIEFDGFSPVIIDDTTLVSAATLFEQLHLYSVWDVEQGTIRVGNERLDVTMQLDNDQAVVNGESVTLAVPPQFIEGMLYVPVRFVSESAGYEVAWSGSSRQVLLTSTEDVELSEGSKGFLWKTEHEQNTVYFLGSIHLADPSMYPLHDSIIEAFLSSNYLVVEVDTTSLDPVETEELVMALGTYQDGTTLKDHISEETYEQLYALVEQFGMPIGSFDMFKPWMVGMTLQSIQFTVAGFESTFGIDFAFLSSAMELGMPILELETMEEQLNIFDQLPADMQEQMISETIAEFDNLEELMNEMLTMWKTGDDDMLLKMTIPEDDSEESQLLEKRLLVDRNIAMVDQIEQFLLDTSESEPTTYFVVVGAAHMLNDTGIIQLLEDKGFSVTRQ